MSRVTMSYTALIYYNLFRVVYTINICCTDARQFSEIKQLVKMQTQWDQKVVKLPLYNLTQLNTYLSYVLFVCDISPSYRYTCLMSTSIYQLRIDIIYICVCFHHLPVTPTIMSVCFNRSYVVSVEQTIACRY